MTLRLNPAVIKPFSSLSHEPTARLRQIAIQGAAIALTLGLLTSSSLEAMPVTGTLPGDPNACPATLIAQDGDPISNGGTLDVVYLEVPGLNEAGQVTFFANLSDSAEDRGLFFFNGSDLKLIARACEEPGCGDPTPIGGTFHSFVAGSIAPSEINNHGDIVFTARVVGGDSEVAHFLYRASTGMTEKIVAAGDTSPRGGVLAVLGGASFNDRGDVVFGAWDSAEVNPSAETYLLRWRDGLLEKIVAPGDVVAGSLVTRVGGSHFILDGFTFLSDPSPFLGEDGRILVNAVSEGRAGILEIQPDESRWIVRSGDPAMDGGAFEVFSTASYGNGRYTFSSRGGPSVSSGIFTGPAGQWQSAWSVGQIVEGDRTNSAARLSGLAPIQDNQGQLSMVLGFESPLNIPRRKLVRWSPNEWPLRSHSAR